MAAAVDSPEVGALELAGRVDGPGVGCGGCNGAAGAAGRFAGGGAIGGGTGDAGFGGTGGPASAIWAAASCDGEAIARESR